MTRLAALLGVLLLACLGATPGALADTVSNGVAYTVVPDVRSGVSPQGPGEWTVNYEKLLTAWKEGKVR